MQAPRTILITGASSGIGAALARAYAAPDVHLALAGRDAIRLAGVAEDCRARGATVATCLFDVADAGPTFSFVRRTDAERPLDLVVANAGISLPSGPLNRLFENTTPLFQANVNGVFNTVHAALEVMTPRRRGQIALMSSLAGFRGAPSAPAYAASKAAVRSYGEGLRGLARPSGIAISVICPGFVTTPMTARNRFPMPFLMDADRAARIIVRGLGRNRGRIAFPLPTYALVWLMNLLPDPLVDRVMAGFPGKD